MCKKITTEIFIEKSKKIHSDKYDYSLVNYVKSDQKVKIICFEHGIFEQTPNGHLNGSNCIYCSGLNKKTTKEFIHDAKKIHNDKYNYSLIEYKGNNIKIKIYCNKCKQFFEQTPHSHLNGSGCPKCGIEIALEKRKLTIDYFIQKAKETHKDKYDYSLVNYINIKTKVKIICSIHGIFEQTPDCHLNRNHNCLKCSIENNKLNIRFSNIEYIEKLKKVHGNNYDYSLVDYINSKTKIKIICPIHGIFKQISHSHLKGNGCPKCKRSKGEIKIENFLKENNIKYETQKTFDGCKFIRKLKFDFYLPKYNLCIEFDGQQHFNSYERYGGIKGFNKRKLYDSIKNKFCLDNNINLLRISYTQIKNIEKILKEKLNLK
jgi:very-short-patch-repair endonuclease